MSKTLREIEILADCVADGDTVENPNLEQLAQKWNVGGPDSIRESRGRRKIAGTAKN